ncbi:hypothetical protein ASPCADRAFT_130608 [Aspergillus carbonarius ITEM 5010]|uniref:Uncharacterized protein n=1 Tax=Aspergillus carbonarius (strain ITEM 5010) TaxID=602072 RepID=A0A1R3RKW1_ASPC5|nr:hypothetical protein ASPCADRAFT_207596 [Aspergillus carbonarius ITEM 5010]OOF95121.1 hypothetical protein ASPCADRAFT_130608 [Aspergillus carbonarius ITEM 5010]
MPIVPRRSRRRGLKTGGRWTEDEKQNLWRLRSQHLTLPWERFRQQFFANRSRNALQKAYSIMGLEKKRSSNMTNTPKIQGRVVKRPVSDQQDEDHSVKETKTTAGIPFEKGLVEETDESESTDESSGSDSNSDSEEETLQGPAVNDQEVSPNDETGPGDETINGDEIHPHREENIAKIDSHQMNTSKTASPISDKNPSDKQITEEKDDVINSHKNPKVSNPETENILLHIPPQIQFLESIGSTYRMMQFKARDLDRVRKALQEEVDTLKQLNETKENKISALQEDVRNHLQTTRRLQQDEKRHQDEIAQQRSENQILSSRIAVLEKKLVITQSESKCETCARVRELTSRTT